MEDSKILWYIVLGAIYFLSKVFGKKKKKNEPEQSHGEEHIPENVPPESKSTSFEDILKEFSKEVGIPETEKKSALRPEPQPIIESPKPLVSETAPPLSYQEEKSLIEEPVDSIDLLEKPIERGNLEFKRDEKFAIKEEYNELADEIHALLVDADGAKQAIVLSEILNRKY